LRTFSNSPKLQNSVGKGRIRNMGNDRITQGNYPGRTPLTALRKYALYCSIFLVSFLWMTVSRGQRMEDLVQSAWLTSCVVPFVMPSILRTSFVMFSLMVSQLSYILVNYPVPRNSKEGTLVWVSGSKKFSNFKLHTRNGMRRYTSPFSSSKMTFQSFTFNQVRTASLASSHHDMDILASDWSVPFQVPVSSLPFQESSFTGSGLGWKDPQWGQEG